MKDYLSFITYQPQNNLLNSILNKYSQKDEIIGIMLIGSFARSDAYPGSDLDLYFLLENGKSKKSYFEVVENILIEYKFTDFEQIQAKFEKNTMELYSFLDGKILVDKKGLLEQLKITAQKKYEEYRISEKEVKAISHWLKSSLIKINAALEVADEFRASYVISTSTWVMLEGIWAVNNKPMPPSGAVWAHILELPNRISNLEQLLKNVFLGNLSERFDASIKIIEWILSELQNESV